MWLQNPEHPCKYSIMWWLVNPNFDRRITVNNSISNPIAIIASYIGVIPMSKYWCFHIISRCNCICGALDFWNNSVLIMLQDSSIHINCRIFRITSIPSITVNRRTLSNFNVWIMLAISSWVLQTPYTIGANNPYWRYSSTKCTLYKSELLITRNKWLYLTITVIMNEYTYNEPRKHVSIISGQRFRVPI